MQKCKSEGGREGEGTIPVRVVAESLLAYCWLLWHEHTLVQTPPVPVGSWPLICWHHARKHMLPLLLHTDLE